MATGSTNTWTGVTTRAPGQISTSLPWLHLNWPRSERKLWREPNGKQNRKHGKRRSGRGKKSEKESGNEKRKQSELQ